MTVVRALTIGWGYGLLLLQELNSLGQVRVVIVFGAGASLANARHFRPTNRQWSHPPLDYTFFQKIGQLESIAVPRVLERYAQRLPSGSPFDSRAGQSRMEEFFRDVFYDYLEVGSSSTLVSRAYLQLVDLYTAVIRETTNWMLDAGHTGGPIGRTIALAAEIADQVDLITFNHDLLIENEIYKRARLRARWCLERGYGSFSTDRKLLRPSSAAVFPAHSDECDHARPIQIHKLHGSLNWIVRIRGREPTHSMLTGQATGYDVRVSQRRAIPGALTISSRGPGGRRSTGYTWPVIVPPVYAKQPLIRAFMPSVWSDARAALEAADRVLFCGYSMPQIDVEAEKLFQRGLAVNAGLPWAGLIDPAPEAARRYAQVLGHMPIRRFANVESFLAQEQPWS